MSAPYAASPLNIWFTGELHTNSIITNRYAKGRCERTCLFLIIGINTTFCLY